MPARQVTLPLNSNDRLYAEIRGMNIETVTPMLQARVRDLAAKESVRCWVVHPVIVYQCVSVHHVIVH